MHFFQPSKTIKNLVAASLLITGWNLLQPCLLNLNRAYFKSEEVDWSVASAESSNLDASLKSWSTLSQPDLAQKLEEFRNVPFQSDKQKQRAAYVLARCLQKTVQARPESARSIIDNTNVEKAKRVVALFEESSKVEGLWVRSQNHIVEVATAAQLEPELRAHLEILKGREKDAATKILDTYLIAQSFYRSGNLDKAANLFEKIQKEAPTSQQAIGSNYYLARIDGVRASSTARGGNSAVSGSVDSALTGPAQGVGADTGANTDSTNDQIGGIGGNETGGNGTAGNGTGGNGTSGSGASGASGARANGITAIGGAAAQAALQQNGSRANLPLTDAAVGYYRAYLSAAPNGRAAREIVDTLLNAANAGASGSGVAPAAIPPSDRELFAEVYYNAGNYEGALQQWSLAGAPNHKLKKAYCLARLGRSREAQTMLLQAISQHEASTHPTYEAVAGILSAPMTKAQTLDFWKQILAAHPGKSDAALWNIATRTPLPEAQPYFQKILSSYPTSEFAPESAWWLFWAGVKSPHAATPKLVAAVSMAHMAMTKYPAAKATAKLAFWSGKVNELLHQPEQAKQDYDFAAKNFPSYYYGLRANVRLNMLRSATKTADRGWSTKPDRNLSATWNWPDYAQITPDEKLSKRYSKTVAELVSLQQLDEAIAELPVDVEPEYKAALRAANDDYAGAIWSAGKNLEGMPSTDLRWQMSYPRMFASDVMAGAHANHLDALLINALIREESRYNPQAISRSKAIGLTQLMPGTAYGVAKRLGVSLSGLPDVYRPEINIKLGSNYLSSVLQRAQNNALLAVASYNGGPNAVQTWLREHNAAGYPDFDYFVENIPFRETRDYVRKVFGSYWVYEKVYSEQ